MDSLLHFAGNFWWLIFPFMGVIGGVVRAIAAANERAGLAVTRAVPDQAADEGALGEASGPAPATMKRRTRAK